MEKVSSLQNLANHRRPTSCDDRVFQQMFSDMPKIPTYTAAQEYYYISFQPTPLRSFWFFLNRPDISKKESTKFAQYNQAHRLHCQREEYYQYFLMIVQT